MPILSKEYCTLYCTVLCTVLRIVDTVSVDPSTLHILFQQMHAAQLATAMLVPGGTALLLQQQHLLAMQEAAKAQLQATALARLGTVHTPFGELPRYRKPNRLHAVLYVCII